MAENNNVSLGGTGFLGTLTLLFIALKLCDVIDWSWWWVLSPIWIPIAVIGVIITVIVLIGVIAIIFNKLIN